METLTNPARTAEELNVISDVLSQAITGELIGMSNFASLAETIDDPHEKMEAVEHANSERMHAVAFMDYAKSASLNVIVNLDGVYWKRVRDHFLEYARKRDFIACLIIQEVMLESFAVSMYTDVGEAVGGALGKLFLEIAGEEKEHLAHSTEILKAEYRKTPEAFIAKFEELHHKCMHVLAEFSATNDLGGHCGVCNGTCMKKSLHHINLDTVTMRGNALALYASALDQIGIPGEISLVWIANLPA